MAYKPVPATSIVCIPSLKLEEQSICFYQAQIIGLARGEANGMRRKDYLPVEPSYDTVPYRLTPTGSAMQLHQYVCVHILHWSAKHSWGSGRVTALPVTDPTSKQISVLRPRAPTPCSDRAPTPCSDRAPTPCSDPVLRPTSDDRPRQVTICKMLRVSRYFVR